MVLTCPGMSQTINSADVDTYVAVIDELITSCEKKSAMGNSASDEYYEVGISLTNSEENIVDSNTIYEAGSGITLEWSSYNLISDNHIYDIGDGSGISVSGDVYNNTIA